MMTVNNSLAPKRTRPQAAVSQGSHSDVYSRYAAESLCALRSM